MKAKTDACERKEFENVIVIMPAYNAEKTLEKTFQEIPKNCIDDIILVDDYSSDNTIEIANRLGISVFRHNKNMGYGANQKTCYNEALKREADVVIMIHPDYQYNCLVIPYALGFLSEGICDLIIGSRIRTRSEAIEGGMPLYKYLSNRILTVIENIVLGQNLGDFHSGFRIFKRKILETIPYEQNSNDFVFDTEILTQAVFFGFRIGDVPIPARYFDEASSVNFKKSVKYGLQTLWVMAKYLIQKTGLYKFKIFYNQNAQCKGSDLKN